MVVVYLPDARNTAARYPVEAVCSVCGNTILYRLGVAEAVRGGVYHRRCPVCRQYGQYEVPLEVAEAASRDLEDSTPQEVRDAAMKWFNRCERERVALARRRSGQKQSRTSQI